ncbi:MAG: single-stranded-DNA-specific exonuclease RecJ [Lachnospiraceae bacterium]|nr:single-stranded-DNA-specific exonuclease RecJ [Lachnospiraceae bacterium]
MSEWLIAAKKADFNSIAARYGISPVLARIIRNRDIITDEDIDMYLNGTLDNLHDPSTMTDMVRACSLIQQYISEGLKIRIIGDYDVDGICATYILIRGLRACGASVDYALPHRVHDGYGINDHLIDLAHADGIGVIITCDNGIAADDQIRHAYDMGMHVIVTDHHEVPYDEDEETGERLELLPTAEAIVDPHREDDPYPYKGICGAVVAWKLIALLLPMCGVSDGDAEALIMELIEEASLATVCDVMELRDENRIIVREGLVRMAQTRNIGLHALIEAVGLADKKLTSYSYGFILGPCLNASGRIDSADRSLELLLSTDVYEAAKIAAELRSYNDERKAMTDAGIARAIDDIENSELKRDRVLVIYLPDIHESVAGLIAGKLKERYERPSIVFTDGAEGIKGSGRSIEAYNMYEELAAHRELYAKFGGHKMAAGLTLAGDVVDELRYRLNEACTLSEADMKTVVMIDVELPLSYPGHAFVNELSRLEPCGNGNPKPVFGLRYLKVTRIEKSRNERAPLTLSVIDKQGGGHKLKLFDRDGLFMSGVDSFYGRGVAGDLCDGIPTDVTIDVIYTPGINDFRGNKSIEFIVNDYRFRRPE